MSQRHNTFSFLVASTLGLLAATSTGCASGFEDGQNLQLDDFDAGNGDVMAAAEGKEAAVPDANFIPDGDGVDFPYCGDGSCQGGETAQSCPRDCGYCGDGICGPRENSDSCVKDCNPCGNGVCDASETVSSCSADCALGTHVRLDRVRKCRSKVLCRGVTTYPEYGYWAQSGVKKRHQKKTFITKLSDPGASRAKRVIFVSAGQQNGLFDDELGSRLTGQTDGYKNGFKKKDGSRWVNMNRGIAHKILERTNWRKDETFVGLAFDARFNFEFSRDEKGDIEEAYYRWLRSKFDPNTVEVIYLAGHSRGGCLISRLAARFTHEFPSIPVVAHSFDGVCTQSGSAIAKQEFGVRSERIPNPVPGAGGKFAFAVNLEAQFPNRENLAFFSQVSGERVALSTNGFCHQDAREASYSSGEARPWLEQEWYNETHQRIDRDQYQQAAINHLVRNCTEMGCL